MLRVEMMSSLRVITTGLLSFTLRRSTSILLPIASLRTAVRRALEKCYGTMHSSTRKRCRDSYGFVFDAHIGDTQVIELNPSSYFGYQLKHVVLHGARRYDEAIEAFKIMFSKLEKSPNTQTQSTSSNSSPFNIFDSLSRLAPTIS
jgi:hypothetical protein